MTTEETKLAQIENIIQNLPSDDRFDVEALAELLRVRISTDGWRGALALALVAAENAMTPPDTLTARPQTAATQRSVQP